MNYRPKTLDLGRAPFAPLRQADRRWDLQIKLTIEPENQTRKRQTDPARDAKCDEKSAQAATSVKARPRRSDNDGKTEAARRHADQCSRDARPTVAHHCPQQQCSRQHMMNLCHVKRQIR